MTSSRNELEADLLKSRATNNQLSLKVQDYEGSIQVICRVRPMSDTETARGEGTAVKKISEKEVEVVNANGESEVFEVDQVFGPGSSQEAEWQGE
jgi:hypothetical protein